MSELDLTVRANNCLRASGIHRIGNLVQKHPEELLAIRAMGKTTLLVIERALSRVGLKLGTSISLANEIKDFESFISVVAFLMANGVDAVADLVTKTKNEILTIPSVDAESLRVLENGLSKWGLSLGMRDPDAEVKGRADKTSDESADHIVCLENAAAFKDELIHAIDGLLSSTGKSRPECFMAYHGVKGGTAATLQKIASSAKPTVLTGR